jgi:hypothetical protein
MQGLLQDKEALTCRYHHKLLRQQPTNWLQLLHDICVGVLGVLQAALDCTHDLCTLLLTEDTQQHFIQL